MATVKFKGESPYSGENAAPPSEDSKYAKYVEDLKLSTCGGPRTRYGFALFGVGRAGTIHLSFLIREPKVQLLYIVEDDKSKWAKLRTYWGLENVTFLTAEQSETVYRDPKVHAVVVASPTYTHGPIVIGALEAEKGVFCEKPIGENAEETKACYETARIMNRPLLSAFNRRFDPSYNALKERVRSGEVGQILTVKVCSRDSPLPSIEYLKISGGIFHDCAVHDIDMVLNVTGEYPTRVAVMAHANIPEIAAIDDFDTVAILMSFRSGAIAIIDLSRLSTFGYDQRLEVFGEKGMIKAENRQPISNVETYTGSCVKKAPISFSFPSRYAEGYELEMLHFIESLSGAPLCIDVRDTLAVSRIAAACEESARTGKAVEIKWAEEDSPSTRATTA